MVTRGRNICNTLKAIRKQIADANGIDYSPEECNYKGECMGTCPKCEQDVRDLEYELHLRQMAGKAIKVAALSSITTLPLFIKYGFDPFCLQVLKLFALFFLFVISATQNIAFDVNSA